TWLITGYYGPVCLYAYFIIGSIIVAVLFPMAASKVFMQEKAEGYFRNQHIKIRDDSEEIALMKSEKNLKSETNKYMGILYTLQRRVVQYTFPVFMFQQFFVFVGAPLSYAIFAFRVFSGYYKDIDPKLIPGMISRSVFISISLVYALSQVVSIASNLPSLFGYAIRISQFWDEIERLELENADREIQRSTDGSFKVIPGSNLLITGPNGCGKSSLLRVISGIWKPANGYVRVPYNGNNVDMYTLPQKTLIVNGSLVEQVIFPLELENVIDREGVYQRILRALRIVGLGHILKREFHEKIIINDGQYYNNPECLDDDSTINLRYSSATWNQVLSPGEVQKLALSRVFYADPKYAILDEATSSLDLTTERQIYSELVNRGMTLISIGHRESLTEFHKNILKMDGQGGFSFSGN
ncbi:hypothetical protein BB560_004132, partial [Smittium megazygosporum]